MGTNNYTGGGGGDRDLEGEEDVKWLYSNHMNQSQSENTHKIKNCANPCEA